MTHVFDHTYPENSPEQHCIKNVYVLFFASGTDEGSRVCLC
jgi:hypothetical protein